MDRQHPSSLAIRPLQSTSNRTKEKNMTAESMISHHNEKFHPPVENYASEIDAALKLVCNSIAPVWPLKDYVAVNPYFGLSDRSFLQARSLLRVFSECEMLPNLEYFAQLYKEGKINWEDIAQAVREIRWPSNLNPQTVEEIVLELVDSNADRTAQGGSTDEQKRIKTIAEHLSLPHGINWLEIITDEISKHCSAHFDDGQSTWQSPWKQSPFYLAWRSIAQIDRNLEFVGIRAVRRLVGQLPLDPEDALAFLLKRLNVPTHLWSVVLSSQAFTVLGWSSWMKYQDDYVDPTRQNLAALLAMRLTYDVALAESFSFTVNWHSYAPSEPAKFTSDNTLTVQQAWLRFALLTATEINYRKNLLKQLGSVKLREVGEPVAAKRPAAQMVFCIDVRSERYRRNLESQSNCIETFGFAGFFGLPIESRDPVDHCCTSQLPVLLKPQFQVEQLSASETAATQVSQQLSQRYWAKLWSSFQSSIVGCFGFVETTGLFTVGKLISSTFGSKFKSLAASRSDNAELSLSATSKCSHQIKMSDSNLADLAEKMLVNLGLTRDFAKLVVFCGHESQTENNPLEAGLDCGACGGHSGELNARFAAQILNRPGVRECLQERGIDIPQDTHFMAAVHNTTTDGLHFFNQEVLPESHKADFESIQSASREATRMTLLERSPLFGSRRVSATQRATDWSEVRPEWGLAGNAAFIVAPRDVTKNANLAAKTFLHSYDYARDTDGSVLETIMTAPMIVANWINMQYFASTVDNRHFGSGNKTIHNVVGRFGVLSGNAGDLRTGLPWQSLHNGRELIHQPLRLLVIIVAPRERIESIIRKHQLVENLVVNGWLHIVASDSEGYQRYDQLGQWQPVSIN